MSDEAPAGEPPRPAKKRKKRKKRGPEAASPSARREGVPAFALSFPVDAELERLVAAFEAGDYALVRDAAPKLARQTESDEVRRAARELRRRVDPDPLMVYLLGVAALLLGVLAYWYWSHPHAGS